MAAATTSTKRAPRAKTSKAADEARAEESAPQERATDESAPQSTDEPRAEESAPLIDPEEHAALSARVAELEADLVARDEKPKNVVEAIVAVMRDVRALDKGERNAQQGFNFRGIDATVNALGPYMRRHGLVILPVQQAIRHEQVTARGGSQMNSVLVEVEYHFYGPGGINDKIVARTAGEAFDSGDKGTAKAMSVAFRTALLQAFALPTQERDPDADSHELAPLPTEAEIKQAMSDAVARAKQAGASVPDAIIAAASRLGSTDQLERVDVNTNDHGILTGSAFIFGLLNEARAAEAKAAAEANARQQSEGAESARGDESANAEDARPDSDETARQQTPDRAPESAPTDEQQTRAAEQTRADVASTRTGEDRTRNVLRSELAGQAGVLGISPKDHVALIIAGKQGAKTIDDLPLGAVRQFALAQRPKVIAALQEQGRATEAAAYTASGNEIRAWSVLTGQSATEGAPAREEQPVG